jgi:hypothetical protein
MCKYLLYPFICLAMLFSPGHALPALAAQLPGSTPQGSWLGFAQDGAGTLPWNNEQLWSDVMPTSYAAASGAAGQSGRGYRWEGPPAEKPDWCGIKRDTVYFIGYQLAAIAVLYVAPESISGWDQEAKDSYSFERWKDNVSYPVWDDDKWYVNYVLHPYWGATYYIRARERGFDRTQSFWYSAILSLLYEYGAEALFEPVSVQDLFVTPMAGALLGEYVFSPIREWVRAKDQLHWPDKAVLLLTDPLGVLNAATDRLLRVNTTVDFQPLRLENVPQVPGVADDTAGAQAKPVWGLHLKIIW